MELEIDLMKDSKLEILEQQLSVAKRLGITNPKVEKTPFGPTWFIESSVFLYGTKHINILIEGLKNSRSSASSVDLLIKIKSKQREISETLASLGSLENINSMEYFEYSIERQQIQQKVRIQPLAASIIVGLMVGLLTAISRHVIARKRIG